MAKRDKDYENRMIGYMGAYKLAKNEGIEALEKDIKRRNILRLDFNVSSQKMSDDYNLIARRTVTNVMAGALWVLHDVFGFGKQRLHSFRENFDDLMKVLADIDYLGERYVRLEDFAIELNEKYDLGIDVNLVAACQEVYDRGDKGYRLCRIDTVLEELRKNGYEDAVNFIESKMY